MFLYIRVKGQEIDMVVFRFRRRKGKEDYSAKNFHQLRPREAPTLRLDMSCKERSLLTYYINN